MQDLKYLVKNPSLVLDNALNLRAKLSYGTALHETFISQEYLWLLKQARPNTTAIDIGAFIGDTAIYLAQSDNIKSVRSFEPHPKSYRVAKQNISESPFRHKIKIFNIALGSRSGTGQTSGTGLGYTKFQKSDSGKGIRVKRIDEVLSGLSNAIIKCDVEGMEIEIFRDANIRNVYAIQLEYHDTKDEMVRILRSKGFRTELQGDKKGVIYNNVGYIRAYRPYIHGKQFTSRGKPLSVDKRHLV